MLRIPDDKYTNVMSSLRKHVKEIRLRTDSLSNDITENDDGRNTFKRKSKVKYLPFDAKKSRRKELAIAKRYHVT